MSLDFTIDSDSNYAFIVSFLKDLHILTLYYGLRWCDAHEGCAQEKDSLELGCGHWRWTVLGLYLKLDGTIESTYFDTEGEWRDQTSNLVLG